MGESCARAVRYPQAIRAYQLAVALKPRHALARFGLGIGSVQIIDAEKHFGTNHVIRKLNPSARIIAASGVSTQMDAARAINCGADSFLPKPYTTSGLLVALQQVLGDIAA